MNFHWYTAKAPFELRMAINNYRFAAMMYRN